MSTFQLHHGDCIEVMRSMPDASVDAIVCDPPYELGFMSQKWDRTGIANNVEMWAECLRVLKPGAHLLAFSGSRTYHRMTCAIEDAGFEVRDQIMWIYSSGFPKSLDVSKAIDKANGKRERDLQPFGDYVKSCRMAKGWSLRQLDDAMGTNTAASWWEGRKFVVQPPGLERYKKLKNVLGMDDRFDELIDWLEAEREVVSQSETTKFAVAPGQDNDRSATTLDITAPATDAALQWRGWGTALKPAHEPICVARKPLIGTVAENVLAFGTGALNIDACRVPTDEVITIHSRSSAAAVSKGIYGDSAAQETHQSAGQLLGRWPANVIHDGSDEVLATFPDAPGQMAKVSGAEPTANGFSGAVMFGGFIGRRESAPPRIEADKSAARFFYCAKAGRADRDEGLSSVSSVKSVFSWGTGLKLNGDGSPRSQVLGRKNIHPTVKPTDLMAYLCRLVTPPGGLVLDPFMGSGSTGKACMRENFAFIGIDQSAEYVDIARARISHAAAKRDAELTAAAPEASGQMPLFEVMA